jgi:hypothetical protein
MDKSNIKYVDNEVSVRVSSGPFLASMPLTVREICPASQDFLLLPNITSELNDQEQSVNSMPTLPYALCDSGFEQVKPQCLEYIKIVSNCQVEDLEKEDTITSKIVWRILKAIWSFLVARQASTLSSSFGKIVRS